MRKGLVFLLKMHKLGGGGLSIVGVSMSNGQKGGPDLFKTIAISCFISFNF